MTAAAEAGLQQCREGYSAANIPVLYEMPEAMAEPCAVACSLNVV